MPELIAQTARLIPYAKRPRQASGFVTAYGFEPEPDDPNARLGNFLAVIEVVSSGRMAEEVADLIIETVGQHYYAETSPAHDKILTRFENAIKAANLELSRYIDRGNAAWVGKLSALLAVQAEDELHLAQTGSAEAFLSRGRASTRITASHGPRGPQANKTFGSITSGSLEAGDRLLLATPALVHQVPLDRLRSILSSNSPAAAVNEFSALLEGTSAHDRIAALVTEVTTPELAALQLRSEQPEDVVLTPDESPLEVAKQVAAPLAATAVTSGKQFGTAAADHARRIQPHLRRYALLLVQRLRRLLQNRRGRQALAGVVVLLVVIIALLAWNGSHNQALTQLQQRYVTDYNTLQTSASVPDLTKLQDEVNRLASDSHRAALDQRLKTAKLPAGAPRSVAALQQAVAARIDQAENLQRVSPTTVADLTNRVGTPTRFEIVGGTAVAVSGNGSRLVDVNLTSGKVSPSTADTSNVGPVVATTLSSNNDGVYILTKAPGVWFYRLGGDSLTAQANGSGSWPVASGIATYAGNIYLLDGKGVEKALRTIAGYGPAAPSLAASTHPELAGARTLAVDGAIYALTDKGLVVYLGGTLQQTLALPASLSHASVLRSVDQGNTLVAVDTTTNRIGLFPYANKAYTFGRQFSLNGVSQLTDATVDNATGTVYAIADGKLVKFSL